MTDANTNLEIAPAPPAQDTPGTCALAVDGGLLVPGLTYYRLRQGNVRGPLRCASVRLNEPLGSGSATDDRGDESNRLEVYLDAASAWKACAAYWRRISIERQQALEAAKTAILRAEANASRAERGEADVQATCD